MDPDLLYLIFEIVTPGDKLADSVNQDVTKETGLLCDQCDADSFSVALD